MYSVAEKGFTQKLISEAWLKAVVELCSVLLSVPGCLTAAQIFSIRESGLQTIYDSRTMYGILQEVSGKGHTAHDSSNEKMLQVTEKMKYEMVLESHWL